MSVWLPEEIITGEILCWLPARPLLRFRSVCKHWRSVIDSPDFIQRTIRNSAATTWSPARDIFLLARQVSYSIPYSAGLLRRHTSPQSLPQWRSDGGITLLGSCHGLVCLGYTGTNRVYLLNPATRKHHSTLQAPLPQGFMARFHEPGGQATAWWQPFAYGFGYDPGIKDYKLARVYITGDESHARCKSVVFCFGISSNTLRAAEIPFCGMIEQRSGVSVGDSLHWPFRMRYGENSIIVAYHLGANQWRGIPLPREGFGHEVAFNVVGLRNRLCVCNRAAGRDELGKKVVHVWMMRRDQYGVEAAWSKLFSIRESGYLDLSSLPVALDLSVNGDEVLLYLDGGMLVWYDTKKERPGQVVYLDGGRLVSVDMETNYVPIKHLVGRMGFDAIACFGGVVRPDGN
ncbi:unnamed protein product [Linum tenue]|uniref:F-box domain-containing protein n=1 Tax=Linum tenue TaxID=586396 RepID=A0AAV0GQ84_9ROSI|nr:unnamed protein product [Linum tenue]